MEKRLPLSSLSHQGEGRGEGVLDHFHPFAGGACAMEIVWLLYLGYYPSIRISDFAVDVWLCDAR